MKRAAASRFPRSAFTLVELIVAGVVATTALIGVYELLQYGLDVERSAARRWSDRAAAAVVADELAGSFQRGVQTDDAAPAILNVGPDGVAELTCSLAHGSGVVRRHRYRWAARSDAVVAGELQRQSIDFAGTSNVSAYLAGPRRVIESEDAFANVPPVVVAKGLKSLRVRFRDAAAAAGDWSETGSAGGQTLVWIVAEVGAQRVERYVRPPVTGKLIGVDK